MKPEVTAVGQQQCPRCRKESRDTAKDNLTLYSDGWQICRAGHGVLSKGSRNDKSFFDIATPSQSKSTATEHLQGLRPISSPAVLRYLWQFHIYEPQRFGLQEVYLGAYSQYNAAKKEQVSYVYIPLGIYIPCNEGHYVIRQVDQPDDYPKVVSNQGAQYIEYLTPSDTLVLCEDAFSAMVIANHGYSAFCLLGTHFRPDAKERFTALYKRFKRCVVWLDKDKAGKQGAQRVTAVTSLFLPTRIVTTDRDPKYMPVREVLSA